MHGRTCAFVFSLLKYALAGYCAELFQETATCLSRSQILSSPSWWLFFPEHLNHRSGAPLSELDWDRAGNFHSTGHWIPSALFCFPHKTNYTLKLHKANVSVTKIWVRASWNWINSLKYTSNTLCQTQIDMKFSSFFFKSCYHKPLEDPLLPFFLRWVCSQRSPLS